MDVLRPRSAAHLPPPLGERPRAVLTDPIFLALGGLWAAMGVAFASGWVPDGSRFDEGAMLVFVLAALLAALRARRRDADAGDRRAWTWLAIALAAWLGSELVTIATGEGSVPWWLLADLGYLVFYAGVLIAIEGRRAAPPAGEPPRDALDTAGALIFCLALLLYFVALPAWLSPATYASWVPSQALYVVLDTVLVVRTAYLAPRMPDVRWRAVLVLFGGASSLWLATDSIDALALVDRLTLPIHSLLDLLWYLPLLLLAAAAALPAARPDEALAPLPRRRYGGVVVYALMLPALHLVHGLVSTPPPALLAADRLIVLGSLGVLGGLALAQRHRLTASYSRVERERAETTRLLREAKAELEARVAARTRELSAANEQLRWEVRERREKEEALVALEKAVETTQVGVTIVDREQRIVYTNPAEARMHGYEREELIGKPVTIFAPAANRSQSISIDELRMQSWHRESVNLRRDGSTFPVLLRSDVVRDADGRPIRVVTTCEDITEQKRTEGELRQSRERLRNLTSRLVAAREEERARISRQVHDELGQTLTALKLDVAWLGSKIASTDANLGRKASSMSILIDQTIAAVQDISADLRPVVLDEFGVGAAIEWQLEHYAERTGLRASFESSRGLTVADRELATIVFRVFQELITNVVRHARAHAVDVTLERVDGGLVLTVADDGVGIPEGAVRDARSLGILGIRERVQRLDGELEIRSRIEGGTVARVRFPPAAG